MRYSGLRLIAFAVSLALILVLALRCSKNDIENDVYREAAKDESIADFIFTDVINQVDLAVRQLENDIFASGGLRSAAEGGCATVTITPFDTLNWPKTFTVDFGPVNCEGLDGKYRRGIITGTATGLYDDSLTVITVDPASYILNNYQMHGKHTMTNIGHVTNNKMTYLLSIQNGTVTLQNGRQFSWEGEFTRIWTEGEWTAWPAVQDDFFEFTGEASGTTYSGSDFFIEVTSPMRSERNCQWIVSGEFRLTLLGYATRTFHYGEGNCDDKATLEGEGISYGITLP